jgi:ribose transport system ATP-binding protein
MTQVEQNAGGATPPAIEGTQLVKAFGGVQALDKASFSSTVGEVHALVGENGAGKSTLIKLLGGRLRPDAGEIRIRGETVTLSSVQAAHERGIWTVFQELTLFPWMTVAENLLLGREPRSSLGLIDRRRLAAEADSILASLDMRHIDPRASVADLSLAERQVIEIVRVMIQDPDMVLFDEPTSSLGEHEVEWLFELIRGLRTRGKCVIFTSHRWNEITSIADRITIFRNGAEVGTFTDIPESEAVTLMTGNRLDAFFPQLPPLAGTPAVLEARNITGEGIRDVSLTLHASEILGVGGLAGHGHRELFLHLFGAHAAAGQISIGGKPVHIRNPRSAARHGIALVPEDRKSEGLLLPMSVKVNLTLPILSRLSSFGLINAGRERQTASNMVRQLQIKTPGLGNPVGQLSGGNQQKVLLGRWLIANSRILLLYDVTRGVDVATKHEIYELIVRLAEEGRAILLYSSDAEELAHLCHRVLVMREARVAAELPSAGLTAETIVAAAVRETRVY